MMAAVDGHLGERWPEGSFRGSPWGPSSSEAQTDPSSVRWLSFGVPPTPLPSVMSTMRGIVWEVKVFCGPITTRLALFAL